MASQTCDPPLPSHPFLILTKQPKNEKLRNLKNVCVNLPSHVPILLTNTEEKSWSFFTLGLQAPRKGATDRRLIHLKWRKLEIQNQKTQNEKNTKSHPKSEKSWLEPDVKNKQWTA